MELNLLLFNLEEHKLHFSAISNEDEDASTINYSDYDCVQLV